MSCRIKKNVVFLTRGDSFWTKVSLFDKDGNEYVPDPNDSIRFAMSDKVNMNDPLIVKTIPSDTLELRLDPEDTKELDVGTYWYDVEITLNNGFVDTFITPTKFILTDEIV